MPEQSAWAERDSGASGSTDGDRWTFNGADVSGHATLQHSTFKDLQGEGKVWMERKKKYANLVDMLFSWKLFKETTCEILILPLI